MQKLFSTRPQPIQLSSDDEDDFNASSVGVGSCIPCLPRFLLGTGPIQLSIEQDATLDDYLDPRTTTSIEPLLDEYNSHGNDAMDGGNDAFGGAILHERSLTRNPFASSSAFGNISSVRDPAPPVQVDFLLETDAEDAEFLSDHRISAVIGDTSKLSRQFELFQAEQQQEDGYKDDSGDRVEPFELDKSDWTATRESSISNEVQQSVIDVPCSLGGEDAAAIPDTCNEGGEYEDTSPITTEDSPINSGSLDNPTSLTDPADDMDKVASITIEQNPPPNDYTYETPTSKEDLVDTSPAAALFSPSPPPSPIPTVSNTLSIRSSSLPHDTPERPTLPLLTTVSTAPSDLPSSQDIPPNDGYIMNGTSIMTSTTSSSPEMVPGAEIDHTGKRRPSVASVAHSFLGDKLDDFTEKLAYIRKNIIMSLDDNNNDDDDDDGDHEDLFNLRQQQHQPPLRRSRSGSLQDWRQQSFDPFVSRLSGKSRQQEAPAHRRSNSMMDMQHPDQQPPTHRSFSSPLLPPPAPRSTRALTGVDEEDDDEDLFDFSKVVAMGKNVRNISEDLMGNGIRLFNDFSTRMKNRQHPHGSSSGDDDSFMNATML